MVIPVSGTLSLNTIQAEHGGINPIGMSEYYRGAGYVASYNTSIPLTGPIATSNFYSTYRISTVADITAALKNTTYSLVRNKLFSKTSYASGMETSTAVTFNNVTSAGYRFSTSVTGSLTFPATYDPAFDRLLATTQITFILRNMGNGTLTNSLTVNGSPVTLTDIFYSSVAGVNVRMSIGYINASYNAMGGISVSATYTKGSSNNENLQELFILPGRWEVTASTSSVGTTAGSLGTAAINTIAMAIRAGQADNNFDHGQWSGTSARTQILRRNSHWYDNSSSQVAIIDTAGTLSYTAGQLLVYDSSGNLTATYDWSSRAHLLTCTVV
jgi:hypothetical protein